MFCNESIKVSINNHIVAKATYDVRDRCISNKTSFKLIY